MSDSVVPAEDTVEGLIKTLSKLPPTMPILIHRDDAITEACEVEVVYVKKITRGYFKGCWEKVKRSTPGAIRAAVI